jgi:uncharacterized Zn finger protein (UPF0148 family)
MSRKPSDETVNTIMDAANHCGRCGHVLLWHGGKLVCPNTNCPNRYKKE